MFLYVNLPKQKGLFILMRKLLITILAIVYLVTSTGFTLKLHYCMGNLAKWGIGSKSSDRCGICGMVTTKGNDNGCCKDESKFVKNIADQKINETGVQFSAPETAILPVSCYEDYTLLNSANNTYNPILHQPPRYSSLALYIRNAAFLI